MSREKRPEEDRLRAKEDRLASSRRIYFRGLVLRQANMTKFWFLKGKSAIQIARVYLGKRKNFTGQHFWARGYFVSTVGMDEQAIREYIRAQEKEDRRLDQMNLFQE